MAPYRATPAPSADADARFAGPSCPFCVNTDTFAPKASGDSGVPGGGGGPEVVVEVEVELEVVRVVDVVGVL